LKVQSDLLIEDASTEDCKALSACTLPLLCENYCNDILDSFWIHLSEAPVGLPDDPLEVRIEYSEGAEEVFPSFNATFRQYTDEGNLAGGLPFNISFTWYFN